MSNGVDAILTIVDQGCSKAAKFIPCTKMIDGEGVATHILQHLAPWFGMPKHVISDHDPQFTAHYSRAFYKAAGTQQNLSTVFHPYTDGQTEIMNAVVQHKVQHTGDVSHLCSKEKTLGVEAYVCVHK